MFLKHSRLCLAGMTLIFGALSFGDRLFVLNVLVDDDDNDDDDDDDNDVELEDGVTVVVGTGLAFFSGGALAAGSAL